MCEPEPMAIDYLDYLRAKPELMTPAQQDAARALSKHPRFKWQRGMSMLRDAPGKADNLRLEHVCHGEAFNKAQHYSALWSESIPDLADPATVGAIGALACELTGKPELSLERDKDRWFIIDNICLFRVDIGGTYPNGPTEGEAWAALILSLPHA